MPSDHIITEYEGQVIPAMRKKFPASVELANTRYIMTVRYAGIKSNDPNRNIARCEKRPLGGLQGILKSMHDQYQSPSIVAYPIFLIIVAVSKYNVWNKKLRTDKDKTGRQSERGTSMQL
jgi:hypothetical protein